MPKPNTLRKSARLLALPLALCLTACGTERVRLVTPPIERTEQVAYPAIPAGEAVCDGAPCLSDREVAGVIARFDAALTKANDKLAWLHDYFVVIAK